MFCGQRSAQPFNFQVLMTITRLAVLEEEEEGGGGLQFTDTSLSSDASAEVM